MQNPARPPVAARATVRRRDLIGGAAACAASLALARPRFRAP